MKFSLYRENVRVVAKAIQSLAKFGSDLYVEADRAGLQLRTFNITKSAMGTFRFTPAFFETFDEGDQQKGSYCKISMKSILPVFKNLKHVERCDFTLMIDKSKLEVQFKLRSECMKNVLISIMDEENVTAAVSKDDAVNVIEGSFKIFNHISNSFNAGEVEITFEAMGNGLTAKNFIEGARLDDKFMTSQLELSPNEFEKYDIQTASAITFSLKEFRSFLPFAENIGEKLTLHFNEAGGPIFLTINKMDMIECSLVMTTVYPDDVSMYDEHESSMSSTFRSSMPPPKRKHSNNKADNVKDHISKKRLSEETTLSNNSTLFNFHNDNETSMPSLEPVRNLTQQHVDMDDEQDDIFLAAAVVADNSVLNFNTTQMPPARQSEVFVTFQSTESNDRMTNGNDDVDSIPQSPQREHIPKLRSIFSRCFESTYVPREPSPSSQVFVANSDTED